MLLGAKFSCPENLTVFSSNDLETATVAVHVKAHSLL
jgi:hypothetical protein